jgi:hypothetical protein
MGTTLPFFYLMMIHLTTTVMERMNRDSPHPFSFPLHAFSIPPPVAQILSLCFPVCYWCDEGKVSNLGSMGDVTYLNFYHSLTELIFLIYLFMDEELG